MSLRTSRSAPRPATSAGAPAAPSAAPAAARGANVVGDPGDAFASADERVNPAHVPDLSLAPPPFRVRGGQAVFVDIQNTEATISLDVAKNQAVAHARVEFDQPTDGCPVIDLVPDAQQVAVDGAAVPAGAYGTVTTPDRAAQLRVLQQPLAKGHHTLEVSYAMPGLVTPGAKPGEFEFKMAMRDLVPRRYMETWVPSNLLFDQHPLTLHLNVANAKAPQLMTNAQVTEHGEGRYTLQFPPDFNACMPFVQVVSPPRVVREEVFQGVGGPIPLKIYARDPKLADEAMALTKKVMAELERDYGPYPHPSFVAHVGAPDEAGVGGMEYAGATETRITALAHELTHSFFGRGFMPGTGNAGWLDEAIASWRDEGYPRANGVSRGPVDKLDGFSPYNRQTTRDAYSYGAQVMSELDYMLAGQGGLKPQLRAFVQSYRGETVTGATFRAFLEQRTGLDLEQYFRERVDADVNRS